MLAVGAAAPAVAAPAASAADDCANAAIRAQQLHGSRLPDCRAYELVSPADKNGRSIFPERLFSASGDQVLVTGPGPLLESLSGLSGHVRASRGANGWTTTPVAGPTPGRFPSLADSLDLLAASRDLSRVLTQTSYPFDARDQGLFGAVRVPSSRDLYRFGDGGSWDWISPGVTDPDLSKETVSMVGADPDLRTVVMQSSRRLVPEVPDESVFHVYVRRDGEPARLVSVLPDGSPVTDRTTQAAASASADATRVAFETGAAGGRRLYARLDAGDPERARTVEVAVGDAGQRCTNAGLHEISPDGRRVRFTCADALVPGATTQSYERDLDGGTTREVGHIGVISARTADHAVVVGDSGGVAIARDGVTTTVLRTAATGTSQMTAAISANARYVAFEAGQPVGRPELGTEYEVYRYDLQTDRLDCVSCGTGGTPPTQRARLRHSSWTPASVRGFALGQVTSDGQVFFTTAAALVPEDTNGVDDAYVWRDGVPTLLSAGTGPAPSEVVGATPDARTVLITTGDSLVPQDVDGGLRDVYALRVDGGFAVPEEAPACRTACQGPIAGPPPAPPVATVDFRSPGDVAADDGPTPAKVRVTGRRTVSGTTATLKVRVPGAGRVKASGPGLRAVSRSATKARTLSVPVRLSERSGRTLRRRGSLTLRATVRFAPAKGRAQTTRVAVTFERAAARKDTKSGNAAKATTTKVGTSGARASRSAASEKGGR